ncbi:response regulator transcription factor [Solirubrobacter taibaiensis]|nr:response regulator transcription factor [Solirubrobacter taibaiensis]
MRHRVLVVDGYPLVRSGLEQLVRAEPVLALAASVAEAADASGVAADVAVLGHGDTSTITTLTDRLPVVVLLDDPAPAPAAQALRAGASGVLHRGAEPSAIARALRAVALGAVVTEPAVAEHLMRPQAPERIAFPQLTRRERDVLCQLSRGATNGQIALALGLSAKTVRNHMSSICLKLRVLDRAQAVIVARDAGLGV